MLYGRISETPTTDMPTVLELLQERFDQEATGYPGPLPGWDAAAGEWAVQVVFHAAQLLLYRSHDREALTGYFTGFGRPKTAAAILSADIILRYLPSILRQLEAIDVEDELIPLLNGVLREWHYTGLLADLSPEDAIDTILAEECLAQLYADRVIERKNKEVAARPELQGLVLAALGDHTEIFWKDLSIAI